MNTAPTPPPAFVISTRMYHHNHKVFNGIAQPALRPVSTISLQPAQTCFRIAVVITLYTNGLNTGPPEAAGPLPDTRIIGAHPRHVKEKETAPADS